jgi:hypothetical protein
MTEQPQSDLAKALQLALDLNELRGIIVLEDLRYWRRVLKSLKEMPKLKPPEKPMKLSEIAPQPKEEEEVEEETEKPERRGVFRWRWRRR